jgi:catechol 2,3-dioxygenase-like lactoylglutathione lyase family enzyme
MADSFKTTPVGPGSVASMTPTIDLVGLVVQDMAAALAFYRRLGLGIPAGADTEPHVEVTLPGGLRLAWDTVETMRSFDPDWQRPWGGARMSLAFRCASPSDVDQTHGELVDAGYESHLKPFDAPWGHATPRFTT